MRRHVRVHVSVLVGTAVLIVGASCSSSDPAPAAQSKESYCSLLLAFRNSDDQLSNDLSSSDAKALGTAMNRLVDQGRLLQRAAPKEIKADTDTVAGYLKALDALLAKYGYDVDKLQADPKGVDEYTSITSDDVNAALDRLHSYGDVDCASTGSSAPASSG